MHSFDPNIAQQVGVNAAVIYQNIRWWCQKNAANERNIIDGKVWSYNSVRAFTTLFPYLTSKQVRSALATLEAEGLILVANHNSDARDRTKWYALADENLVSEKANAIAPEGKEDCPTGQNTFAPEGEPLPDSKPVIKPDDKHTLAHRDAASSDQEPSGADLFPDEFSEKPPASKFKGGLCKGCHSISEEFERVWAHYPRKVGKGRARSSWETARKKATFEHIARPLSLFIKLKNSEPIDKIPHFTTWLNQERWDDDQTHAINRAATTSERLDRLGAFSTEAEGDEISGPTRTFPEIELRID